jgi:hypothetical protein
MTTSTEIYKETDTHVKKNLELVRRFTLYHFEDPSLLDDILDGITLSLIPDDDEDLARVNLEMALGVARSGSDVLIRHIRPSELPT